MSATLLLVCLALVAFGSGGAFIIALSHWLERIHDFRFMAITCILGIGMSVALIWQLTKGTP